MTNTEKAPIHPTHKLLNASQLREVLDRNNLHRVASILIDNNHLSACDIGLLISHGESPISFALIATKSIQYFAEPEIAVLYTFPKFRGKGFGKQLVIGTLDFCQKMGFPTVHINASSQKTALICNNLPQIWKQMLQIHDSGFYIDELIAAEENLLG